MFVIFPSVLENEPLWTTDPSRNLHWKRKTTKNFDHNPVQRKVS